MNKKMLFLSCLALTLVAVPAGLLYYVDNVDPRVSTVTVKRDKVRPLQEGRAQTFLTQEKQYPRFNSSLEFTNETRFYDVPSSLNLEGVNITPYDGWRRYSNSNVLLNYGFEKISQSYKEEYGEHIPAGWTPTGSLEHYQLWTADPYNHAGNNSVAMGTGTEAVTIIIEQPERQLFGGFTASENFTFSYWVDTTDSWGSVSTSFNITITFVTTSSYYPLKYTSLNITDISGNIPIYPLYHRKYINYSDPWDFEKSFNYYPLKKVVSFYDDLNKEEIENVGVRFSKNSPSGSGNDVHIDNIYLNYTGFIRTGIEKKEYNIEGVTYSIAGYRFNGKLINKTQEAVPIPISKKTGNGTILVNDTINGHRRFAFDLKSTLKTDPVSGEKKQGKLAYHFDAPSFGEYRFDHVEIKAKKPAAVLLSEEGAKHKVKRGNWRYSGGQVIVRDNAFIADYFSQTGSAESFEVQLAYESDVIGDVDDKKGNALRDMTAVLENLDTGGVYSKSTESRGEARFRDVPSGQYLLTVRGHGLKSSKKFTVSPYRSVKVGVDTTLTAPYVVARSLRYSLTFIPLIALVPIIAVGRIVLSIYMES